ncbi:histidine kinase [Kitasatospora sp. NPDC097643]|uniref:sensor histidine kinase n=1 Tax=Kitasatospora sp. NPDC097643 TaxID=3157230 RepID=UPI00331AAC74
MPAPALALTIQLSAFVVICLSGFLWLLSLHLGEGRLVLSVVFLTSTLGILIRLCWPGRCRRRAKYRFWTLGLLAAFTFLPNVLLHDARLSTPGFLAGALLLTLPGPAAWSAFLGVVVLSGALADSAHEDLLGTCYFTSSITLSGLIVFGLTRMSDMVLRLQAAQAELALLAVERERSRFARDLHDLLGYSLSTITLRSELTYRLVESQPERAREEISAVLDVSRQALADVRQVAHSYRDMSLAAEAASVRSVLDAAGIEADLEIACTDLPSPVSTVLASVLREGVTNILRHSRAQRCVISARTGKGFATLTMENDGAAPTGTGRRSCPAAAQDGGSGLANLATRLAAINGTITAGPVSGQRFRLVVEVPLPSRVRSRPRAHTRA